MEVYFYQCFDDSNKLRKNPILKFGLDNVDVKESMSMLHPSLVIHVDRVDLLTGINYISIPFFGNRFYFITKKTALRGKQIQIDCDVDVLYTYSESIQNLVTLIDRQEFLNNPYYYDTYALTFSDSVVQTVNIGRVKEDTQGIQYSLNVNGVGSVSS